MTPEMPTAKFKCNLHRTGVFLPETIRLLIIYPAVGSYEKLREKVIKENILAKMSSQTTIGMLRAFRQRFFKTLALLPPVDLLAKAINSALPEIAQKQILFPYYLLSDSLVENVYRNLVLTRLDEGILTFSRDDVVDYLEHLSFEHPELKGWARYTRMRWARGMLSLLRNFDLLEKAPSTRLIKLYLRRETFAFYWLWLRQNNYSVKEATEHELWSLLQVSTPRIKELLFEGQKEGWWNYLESGQISEFNPVYASVEEWLQHVVG